MASMLGEVADEARSVMWPWYHDLLQNELTAEARQVLETYSGIAPAEVESHIYKIRDKAWGVFPWPCVGEFWFLSFGLAMHPLYRTMILPRLKAGQSLLDLGSCLGQDIRKCIFDGAPADNLYASDLFPEYEQLAFDFFNDADRLPRGHFLAEDILADNDSFSYGPLMSALGPGQTDIIAITMFLHVFNYANQLRVATRILRLLSHQPGSLVVGSQAGAASAGEIDLKPPFAANKKGEKRTVYRHSPQTFERLWQQAGRAAGVPLRVSAVFQSPAAFTKGVIKSSENVSGKKGKSIPWQDTRRLYFSIMRS